jgi:hypothetical protein
VQDTLQRELEKIEAEEKAKLDSMDEIPGQEAYYNDDYLLYLVEEANAIESDKARAENRKARKSSAKIFKQAAEIQMSNLSVREVISYKRWSAIERRLNRLLGAALESGDKERIAEIKQRHTVAYARAKASFEFFNRYKKMRSELVKARQAKAGTIVPEFQQAIGHILQAYGFVSPSKKPMAQDKYDEIILGIENGPSPLPLPEEVRSPRGISYKDLTVTEFQNLYNGVLAIKTRGSLIIEMIEDGKQYTIEEIKEKAIATLQDSTRKRIKQIASNKAYLSIGETFRKYGRAMMAEVQHVRFIMRIADNYQNTTGDLTNPGQNEKMFNEIMFAYTRMLKKRQEFFDNYYSKWLPIFGETAERLHKKGKVLSSPYIDSPIELFAPLARGGHSGFTAENIWALALNMGNIGNRQAVIEGYETTEADVKKLLGLLTTKEAGVVQEMWDALSELSGGMNATFRKLNGYEVKLVEADEFSFTTADGTEVSLRGGYYPLRFDRELSIKFANISEEELSRQTRLSTYHFANARSDFTKERKGGKYPVNLRIQTLMAHVDDSLLFTYLSLPANNFYKVVIQPEYAQSFKDIFGPEAYEALVPWLNNLVGGTERAAQFSPESIIARYQKSATVFALGINLMTMAKQTFSLTSTARRIGMADTIRGLKFVLSQPLAARKLCFELSAFMRERDGKTEQDIKRIIEENQPFNTAIKIGGKKVSAKMLQELALGTIKVGDTMAAIPSWWGAYYRSLDKGNSQEQAVKDADILISNTQPVTDAVFKNLWQIGGKSPTPAGKLLRWVVSPYTGWTMLYGNISREAYGAWKEGKMSNAEYAHHAFLEHIAPVILTTILQSAIKPERKDETFMGNLAFNSLSYYTSWAPGINAILPLYRYGPMGGFSLPVRLMGDKIYRAMKTGKGALSGENTVSDALLALAEIVAFHKGIAVSEAYKELRDISDTISGNRR